MKEETARLLDRSSQELRAARLLVQEGLTPMAASRAYYALFYTAEALLFEEGLQFSSHGELQSAFGKEFSKTGRLDPKFHRYLLDAYDQRQDADYEASSDPSQEEIGKVIGWGDEFLEAAKKFLLNKMNKK